MNNLINFCMDICARILQRWISLCKMHVSRLEHFPFTWTLLCSEARPNYVFNVGLVTWRTRALFAATETVSASCVVLKINRFVDLRSNETELFCMWNLKASRISYNRKFLFLIFCAFVCWLSIWMKILYHFAFTSLVFLC